MPVPTPLGGKNAHTAVLGALLLGVILRLANPNVAERTNDELAYGFYAQVVASEGVVGFRALVDRHLDDPARWGLPPPTRVGYIMLAALAVKTTGLPPERALEALSCAGSIASLVLLAWFGLRRFNTWVVFTALILLSVSPLDLAMARRAWQDDIMALFGGASLLCCFEWTCSSRRGPWLAAWMACAACCVLIKETGLLVIATGAIWMTATLWRERRWRHIAVTLAICATLSGLCAVLMALGAGGFEKVSRVLEGKYEMELKNAYVLAYQTGSWHDLLCGIWMLSPASTSLALLGMVLSIFHGPALAASSERLENRFAAGMLAGCSVFFFFVIALTPRLQNLRVLSPLIIPFYLMCGLAFAWIGSLARERFRSPRIVGYVLIALLLLAAVEDYRQFRYVFVDRNTLDPAAGLLKRL